MRIHKRTILPLSILIMLVVAEIFMNKINILRYTEEVIAIFFGIYIIAKIIKNKGKVPKNIFKILILCMIVVVIGLLSNIIWRVQISTFAILVDILATFKLIICSIGFYLMVSEEEVQEIVKIFIKPAKLLLIVGFILSIISLFVDISMRGQKRFGIYGFNFIFEQAHIYSMMVIFCVLITFLDKNTPILKSRIYLFFAMVQMILTTKGPSIIWAVTILILLAYMKKREKIGIKLIIALGIISVLFGGYQIRNYLLKDNAPRAVFYKYGIVTSQEYFPLGSGFATFGSDMAAKYYSPLYEQYGFNVKYGMKENENMFLNDNYWPCILGQFGWIGVLIFLYIAYKFFSIIQNKKLDYSIKAIVFSAYFYTVLHSLGSSTFAMSVTVILYLGIIMAFKLEKKEEKSIEKESS